MDALLIAIWAVLVQVGPVTAVPPAPINNANAPALLQALVPVPVIVKAAPKSPRCDARQYQRLVGRTVSDLLTARLPQGARVYRLDDPITETIAPGRLSVELNRSTRVRRVYCS